MQLHDQVNLSIGILLIPILISAAQVNNLFLFLFLIPILACTNSKLVNVPWKYIQLIVHLTVILRRGNDLSIIENRSTLWQWSKNLSTKQEVGFLAIHMPMAQSPFSTKRSPRYSKIQISFALAKHIKDRTSKTLQNTQAQATIDKAGICELNQENTAGKWTTRNYL